MVQLINPLFSNSAHGRVGGIVFQNSKNGNMARVHVPQRYRPTTLQLLQNYKFGHAVDLWREQTPEEQEVWNQKAVPFRMSGYNLFVKENI